MNDRDTYLEHAIRDAIAGDLRRAPNPPLSKDDAWERLQERRKTERKGPRTGRAAAKWRIYAAATAAAALLVVSFSMTDNGYAFGWISKYFSRVSGSVTEIGFSTNQDASSRAKKLPSFDDIQVEEASKQETVSLEEARKRTGFEIQLPKTVPPSFTLKGVLLTTMAQEKSSQIVLEYKDGDQSLTIQETLAQGPFNYSVGLDNEDTEIKDVTIRGQKGAILFFKDGSNQLIWNNQSLQFKMESRLPESVPLEVANSL